MSMFATTGSDQPYPDREAVAAAFAEHVNRGKVDAYELLGLDIVMGDREGSWFTDAYDPSRRYLNCHCNGGVFNLGHRNADVIVSRKYWPPTNSWNDSGPCKGIQ